MKVDLEALEAEVSRLYSPLALKVRLLLEEVRAARLRIESLEAALRRIEKDGAIGSANCARHALASPPVPTGAGFRVTGHDAGGNPVLSRLFCDAETMVWVEAGQCHHPYRCVEDVGHEGDHTHGTVRWANERIPAPPVLGAAQGCSRCDGTGTIWTDETDSGFTDCPACALMAVLPAPPGVADPAPEKAALKEGEEVVSTGEPQREGQTDLQAEAASGRGAAPVFKQGSEEAWLAFNAPGPAEKAALKEGFPPRSLGSGPAATPGSPRQGEQVAADAAREADDANPARADQRERELVGFEKEGASRPKEEARDETEAVSQEGDAGIHLRPEGADSGRRDGTAGLPGGGERGAGIRNDAGGRVSVADGPARAQEAGDRLRRRVAPAPPAPPAAPAPLDLNALFQTVREAFRFVRHSTVADAGLYDRLEAAERDLARARHAAPILPLEEQQAAAPAPRKDGEWCEVCGDGVLSEPVLCEKCVLLDDQEREDKHAEAYPAAHLPEKQPSRSAAPAPGDADALLVALRRCFGVEEKTETILAFAARVRSEEIEACAKVAEGWAPPASTISYVAGRNIGIAIRARASDATSAGGGDHG